MKLNLLLFAIDKPIITNDKDKQLHFMDNYIVLLTSIWRCNNNEEKKAQFLNVYKKYKRVMHYVEETYKLTMNDVAILELIRHNCRNQNMLMQPFLKIATTELELSRTKVLASSSVA